jgi:hypothetical protein
MPPCRADPALVIHYAPAENLEHIDVALIDTAKHEIDMAAYVLTDWPMRPLSARLLRTRGIIAPATSASRAVRISSRFIVEN